MIETRIIASLINDDQYFRKVLPYIKAEYFTDSACKNAYKLIKSHADKYGRAPSKESVVVEANDSTSLTQDEFGELTKLIDGIDNDGSQDQQWLVDKTEQFCQDRAVYNAIMSSIQILDGKTEQGKGAIPEILTDALSVSFDTHIGHDLLEDAASRFDFYHQKEKRIAFDLEYLNKITRGGVPNKTLNVILAGTGVGKSLFMCHCASSNLLAGLNVLYITMEMAEEKIAERIDANLLNITLDKLRTLSRDAYETKLSNIKGKTSGKLIVKEYPTAGAGSANFRHLLNELKHKKAFVPDVIYIDYLNICMSSRIRQGANVNSYTYVKAIAEELRGLAVEFGVPIFTATQTTRSGFTSTDIGLEDTSESFGLPATADLMIALIATEELTELNQVMVKQLKNRYSDPTMYRKFVIGVDRAKMKLYDVEQAAQDDIIDDVAESASYSAKQGKKPSLPKSFEGFA